MKKINKREKQGIDGEVLAEISKARGRDKAIVLKDLVLSVFEDKAEGKEYPLYEAQLKNSLRRLRRKGEYVWVFNSRKGRKSVVFYPIAKEEIQEQIGKYKSLIKSAKISIALLENSIKKDGRGIK
jgi:hypothetical protein